MFSHNLALGVIAGVLLSTIFFARRVAHLVDVTTIEDPEGGSPIYAVTGELFCASTTELIHAFDYQQNTPAVVVDLTDAPVWDRSAVAVLDTIVAKFERCGTAAEIVGLNDASAALHGRLSGHFENNH